MQFLWVEFAQCKQYLMDSYDKYHSSYAERTGISSKFLHLLSLHSYNKSWRIEYNLAQS